MSWEGTHIRIQERIMFLCTVKAKLRKGRHYCRLNVSLIYIKRQVSSSPLHDLYRVRITFSHLLNLPELDINLRKHLRINIVYMTNSMKIHVTNTDSMRHFLYQFIFERALLVFIMTDSLDKRIHKSLSPVSYPWFTASLLVSSRQTQPI